jgi:hypothetical protein
MFHTPIRRRILHEREYNERLNLGVQTLWKVPSASDVTIIVQDNITIIQDAALACGTKSRFLLDFLRTRPDVHTFYYAGSPYGHLNMALAQAVRVLRAEGRDVKAVVVGRARYRKYNPPGMRVAQYLGADVLYTGESRNDLEAFLINAAQDPKVYVISKGAPELSPQIAAFAKKIADENGGQFDEFWYTSGSGATGRAAYEAGVARAYTCVAPNFANYRPVIDGFKIIVPDADIDSIPKRRDFPPFASWSNLDCKAWPYLKEAAAAAPNKRFLFWNII